MQKGDFFPEKMMEGIFVYVLEFMSTLDKMQNISTLMCKSSKSEGRTFESHSGFSYCTLITV